MIKAVIFDLDETLVSGLPIHLKAGKIVHDRYNIDILNIPEEKRALWHGMRILDIEQDIINFFKLSVDAKELLQERMKVFLEIAEKELPEKENATKVIQDLHNKGYRIGLATSATKEYVDAVLKRFKWRFDAIVSGDDVLKGKPDPETFSLSCELLKILPEEGMVVEDANYGISAAKNAGCKCIGIPSTNNLPQDLSRADIILNSLNEITKELLDTF